MKYRPFEKEIVYGLCQVKKMEMGSIGRSYVYWPFTLCALGDLEKGIEDYGRGNGLNNQK